MEQLDLTYLPQYQGILCRERNPEAHTATRLGSACSQGRRGSAGGGGDAAARLGRPRNG